MPWGLGSLFERSSRWIGSTFWKSKNQNPNPWNAIWISKQAADFWFALTCLRRRLSSSMPLMVIYNHNQWISMNEWLVQCYSAVNCSATPIARKASTKVRTWNWDSKQSNDVMSQFSENAGRRLEMIDKDGNPTCFLCPSDSVVISQAICNCTRMPKPVVRSCSKYKQ